MPRKSKKRKLLRNLSKKVFVESMGGKCVCCNYSKCIKALELHHINPNEKDFSFNSIIISKNSWPKIVNELNKCILVCANCHRELHDGIITIPENPQKFIESYYNYDEVIKLLY